MLPPSLDLKYNLYLIEIDKLIEKESDPDRRMFLKDRRSRLLALSNLTEVEEIEELLSEEAGEINPDFVIESLTVLATETIPGEKWLIDNLIPAEGFALIAGEEATGKSFLTLSLASAITTGSKWLDQFEVTQQTEVLFIDKENGRRRMQDRMRGLTIMGEKMYRIKFPHLFYLSEGDNTSKFAQHVAKFVDRKRIGLIIVDSFVDIMEGNENLAGDVQVFFNKFRFLFPSSAILILHHEGKPGQVLRTAAQKTRGSTNVQGQMVASFSVSRIPKTTNELRFEQTKARDSEKMKPFKINMVSQIDPLNPKHTLVTRLMYAGEIEDVEAKSIEVIDIIKNMLPDEYDTENTVTRKDIDSACAITGASRSTIRDVIDNLKIARFLGCEKMKKGNAFRYFRPTLMRGNLPYNDD